MKGGYRNIAPKKQTFDKSGYDQQYAKDHLMQVRLSLNRKHDSDIIKKLQSVPNRSGYIKKLIREDLKNDADHSDQ